MPVPSCKVPLEGSWMTLLSPAPDQGQLMELGLGWKLGQLVCASAVHILTV